MGNALSFEPQSSTQIYVADIPDEGVYLPQPKATNGETFKNATPASVNNDILKYYEYTYGIDTNSKPKTYLGQVPVNYAKYQQEAEKRQQQQNSSPFNIDSNTLLILGIGVLGVMILKGN